LRTIFLVLFKICLVLLLCGGSLLVLGQMAGVLLQNGAIIRRSWDLFADPTFVVAAVAGVLAFVLSYFRSPAPDDTPSRARRNLRDISN